MVASTVSLFMGAIVRMHRQLARAYALPRTDVAQQLAGQLGTLAIEHLPVDDLAAEQVFKQVQIKVLAAHLGGQIRDVPTDNLIGPGRCQSAWLVALLRCALQASMANWPCSRSTRYIVDSEAT